MARTWSVYDSRGSRVKAGFDSVSSAAVWAELHLTGNWYVEIDEKED